ncbi:efflux transporter outer membrane subunit [Collimonas sp.]|jgi:multidrug efflux system outer membrane protein|uniref:efflux transporter outer membrane subunit n=1 Tax=Collimonas sp. TaxID=1963772 RepID=UPI002D113859|nr:efflux transporter outer membrane subunit [Collimonas sp.]HWW99974.1 efflux transporter outer membrane subunit [Collimonas sp.]
MRNTLLIPGLALLLGGCVNLAPDYARPAAPVPATWSQSSSQGAVQDAAAEIAWRSFFTDARLREVIALTLANNRDLRVAVLNIEKARAQYRIQDAASYPALGVAASSSTVRTPASQASGNAAGIARNQSVQLGFSSYELDFFGRLKNLSTAALASYQFSVEMQRSVQISLVAEVAGAWLTLAADNERRLLAKDTLKSQQISYDLSQRSHAIGATSGLDLSTAQASVEAAQVDLGEFTSRVQQDLNALNQLAGAAVPAHLLPDSIPQTSAALLATPAQLSSDLLLQRPDVLAAEQTLIAAYADIGAARAAFFPSITLTAAGGTASSSLAGLFKPGSGAWSFLPAVNLPIFNAGSNRASLDAAKVSKEIEIANYEKAIQIAFREIADALAERATLDQRLGAQQRLADASGKSYRLSEARYRSGIDSYLNSLVAERSWYGARQNLISLRLLEQSNRINLYKAMGGGWSDP